MKVSTNSFSQVNEWVGFKTNSLRKRLRLRSGRRRGRIIWFEENEQKGRGNQRNEDEEDNIEEDEKEGEEDNEEEEEGGDEEKGKDAGTLDDSDAIQGISETSKHTAKANG